MMFRNFQWDQHEKTADRIISEKSEDCRNENRGASMTNLHRSSGAPTSSDSHSKTTNKKGGNNKRHQEPDTKGRNREIQRRYREKSKMKAAEAEDALEKLGSDLQEAQEEKALLLSQATVLSEVNVYLDSLITTVIGAGSKAAQTINQFIPSWANFATMNPLDLMVEHGIFPPDFVIRRHIRRCTLDTFDKTSRMFCLKVNELVQQWNEDPSSRQVVEQKLGACFRLRLQAATILREERPDVMGALIFSGDNATVHCNLHVPVDLKLSAQQIAQVQVGLQKFKAKQAILKNNNDLATQSLTESVARSLEATSIKDQFSAHISTLNYVSMLEAQNIQRLHAILNLYIAINETLTPIQMGKFLVARSLNVEAPGVFASHQASLTATLNLLDKVAGMI